MQDNEQGDRLAARHTVLLHARCRKSSWHVFPVELGDISQGGCSIVGSSSAFVPGERLRLNVAHLKPIEAQVRWLSDEKVGLEFVDALSGRLIEDLGKLYGVTIE
ncbi:PilZ domain-containing protein [Novosphingobium sp. FGD1]|jgi:hypothetical protein|uniref:PilZ domain-containing protein n=1 Tax=Novosphingobium silvae TaxID=2692619 RepID=A0A7X4K637_9SPHN|nr:PilZ domain-containing protein [Novosphingobium silvae]MYL96729.1 PilZ domain-containing protein [Novosphingobium silvae]